MAVTTVKKPDYSQYATDHAAGDAEQARLGQLYNTNKKAGNMVAANEAHTQANAIRDAMGTASLHNRADGSLLNPAKEEAPPVAISSTNTNVPQNNNADLIKSLYDSMYASQSQRLKATRDSQLAGLAGQDTAIQNNAQSALNQNSVSGARLADQLRERMANLGILQGGDYISQQVAQNTGQQQNANEINMDMSTRLQNLLAQKDAINNNASAEDLALLQSIQAQMAQAQIGQNNADRSFGLEEAGLTGQYNGGQTLAARGLGLQAQNQTFNQNLATNQFNQSVNNDAFNQGMANKQFEFTKAQNDWENTFREGQFDLQKAAQVWDQNFKTKSFDQGVKEFAQQMGHNYASLSQRDKEFVADMAYKNEAMKLNKDQFTQQKFETDVAHAFKRREFDLAEKEVKPLNYKEDPDFKSDIANMVKNPNAAREALRTNSDAYIAKYGIEGYNYMIGLINK